MKRPLSNISSLLLVVLIISACGPGQMLGPTITPVPTNTPIPTSTSTATPIPPTATPAPTLTPTIMPTSTTTPTPAGSGQGKIVFAKSEVTSVPGETIDNIYIINVDGSGLKALTDNNQSTVSFFDPEWSPIGDKILYSRGEDVSKILNFPDYWKSELFVMRADGTGIQKISPSPQYKGTIDLINRIYDFQGSWSPDGKSIVFASNRHSILGSNDVEVFIIDLESFEIRQLTNATGESWHPTWSHDGQTIAFMSDRDGDFEIYMVNVDGTGLKQLTKNHFSDRFPNWSPDGLQIIFHSDRDGNIELYTIDTTTLTETRRTKNPAIDASASWSPDGRWIAYASDQGGNHDIYIMRLDGSEIYNLTSGDNDDDAVPSWSP